MPVAEQRTSRAAEYTARRQQAGGSGTGVTPAAKPHRKKHLPALTGLRFALAVWVIVHHLTGPGMMLEGFAQSLPAAAQMIVRGGWVAVQVFFILSGLVLARSYGSTNWDRRSLFRYAVARLARVYPGYLLSLAVVSPFIYYTLVYGSGRDFAPGHKAALLTDYALVLQGWTGALGVGWNTPAWSLSCEFVFYLCFPLIALAFGSDLRRRTLISFLLALALPSALSLAGVPGQWKPVHHLADFFMGIAAAGVLERVRIRGGAWVYVPAGAVFLGIVAYPHAVEQFLVLNTALRPVAAALLIGLGIGGGFVASLLSSRPAGFLGQASYSMYILHVPLLWWLNRYQLPAYFHFSPNAAACAYIASVIVVSAVAFRYFEEPVNVAIRNRIQRVATRRIDG